MPVILQGLKITWQHRASDPDTAMLWAACCLGLFGFMRAGEFTVNSTQAFDPTVHLTAADVSVDRHQSPSLLCIRLNKQSKNDPFWVGVSLFLWRTGRDLCPVTAVLGYPPNVPRPAVYVLGWVLPNQRQAGGASTGRPPTYEYRFSGHSFRIGVATTAAQVGIQDVTVKCWADGSHPLTNPTFTHPGSNWLESWSSWPKSNGERSCMTWTLNCA